MNLFIKPIELEKTAYLRISENPAEWTRDVMENFYNTFPYFINYPVRVEFKQKDEQKGYAVGAIHIENGAGIQIPIIIQNRELYPFDVALLNGQIIPLSNYTISTYLSGKTPFQKTVKRETGDITTLLFSSGGLGYMREVPMETYKAAEFLLDKVLPNTSIAEREKVLGEISDPSVAEGFRVNGTGACVIKIASEKHDASSINTVDKVAELLERDIWYIYKTGEFSYKGIFGNSKIDGALTYEDLDAEQVNAFKGELIKCAEKKSTVAAHGSAKPVAVLPIKNSDHSIVLLDNGDYVQIPNHMYVDAPVKISMDVPGHKPELRKTGIFKLANNLYSEPFEVTHMYTSNGVDYVEGESALQKYAYALYDVDTISVIDGYTWLPRDTKFVKLGKCDKTFNKVRERKHRVIKTATELSIDGKTPVDTTAGIWALIQEGAQLEDIKKIASLRDGACIDLSYELNEPLTSIEKIASEYDEQCTTEAKLIAVLARDLTKEASLVPDIPTVDKVLALNFINKDTLNTFVEAIPNFEQAAWTLADMLVKARVGVQLVSEAAIRKVMFGLLEIIEVLRGVKTVKG
jgi:hypothetical protein